MLEILSQALPQLCASQQIHCQVNANLKRFAPSLTLSFGKDRSTKSSGRSKAILYTSLQAITRDHHILNLFSTYLCLLCSTHLTLPESLAEGVRMVVILAAAHSPLSRRTSTAVPTANTAAMGPSVFMNGCRYTTAFKEIQNRLMIWG